ncbi:MAG: hypothetical protein QNJ31_00975 [Candidatus Caenarcaniphilales bacterium]|nr:hypothetical protein [Candidatus Caenarcaniphilales bacterium]
MLSSISQWKFASSLKCLSINSYSKSSTLVKASHGTVFNSSRERKGHEFREIQKLRSGFRLLKVDSKSNPYFIGYSGGIKRVEERFRLQTSRCHDVIPLNNGENQEPSFLVIKQKNPRTQDIDGGILFIVSKKGRDGFRRLESKTAKLNEFNDNDWFSITFPKDKRIAFYQFNGEKNSFELFQTAALNENNQFSVIENLIAPSGNIVKKNNNCDVARYRVLSDNLNQFAIKYKDAKCSLIHLSTFQELANVPSGSEIDVIDSKKGLFYVLGEANQLHLFRFYDGALDLINILRGKNENVKVMKTKDGPYIGLTNDQKGIIINPEKGEVILQSGELRWPSGDRVPGALVGKSIHFSTVNGYRRNGTVNLRMGPFDEGVVDFRVPNNEIVDAKLSLTYSLVLPSYWNSLKTGFEPYAKLLRNKIKESAPNDYKKVVSRIGTTKLENLGAKGDFFFGMQLVLPPSTRCHKSEERTITICQIPNADNPNNSKIRLNIIFGQGGRELSLILPPLSTICKDDGMRILHGSEIGFFSEDLGLLSEVNLIINSLGTIMRILTLEEPNQFMIDERGYFDVYRYDSLAQELGLVSPPTSNNQAPFFEQIQSSFRRSRDQSEEQFRNMIFQEIHNRIKEACYFLLTNTKGNYVRLPRLGIRPIIIVGDPLTSEIHYEELKDDFGLTIDAILKD